MGLQVKETPHTSNTTQKEENSYGFVNSKHNYSHNEKWVYLHYCQCKYIAFSNYLVSALIHSGKKAKRTVYN